MSLGICECSSDGRAPSFQVGGRGFESRHSLCDLAQLVERWSLEPVVVGSSPTVAELRIGLIGKASVSETEE